MWITLNMVVYICYCIFCTAWNTDLCLKIWGLKLKHFFCFKRIFTLDMDVLLFSFGRAWPFQPILIVRTELEGAFPLYLFVIIWVLNPLVHRLQRVGTISSSRVTHEHNIITNCQQSPSKEPWRWPDGRGCWPADFENPVHAETMLFLVRRVLYKGRVVYADTRDAVLLDHVQTVVLG